MSRRVRLRWALSVAALLSCDGRSIDDITAEDIVTVSPCAGASGCVAVADGRTPVVITFTTRVPAPRRTDFAVQATLSSGTWESGSSDMAMRQTRVPLYFTESATRNLIPPATLGRVFVLATYTPAGSNMPTFESSASIPLAAAPLAAVELRAMGTAPYLQPTGISNVPLSAVVRTKSGGAPTAGTAVRFEVVEVQPPGASVFVTPAAAVTDAQATVTALLSAASMTTSVTLRATATPPADGITTPAPVTGELTLGVLK